MFPVLAVGSYILLLTSLNRYLNIGSDEKLIFTAAFGNICIHDQTWSMPNKYATLRILSQFIEFSESRFWENALFWFVLHCILYRRTA